MKLRPRQGHVPSGKSKRGELGEAPSKARKEPDARRLGPPSLASSSLKIKMIIIIITYFVKIQ